MPAVTPKSNEREISGVVVPILTPLTPDGAVDVASLRRLVSYVIDNGIHGIWAAGTTGEFAALDEVARRLVIETVVDEAAGRVPVIGNASAAATNTTIATAEALRDFPLTGIAATPPYYYSHTQAELADHFRAIADRCAQPLWVYNIPSMVKVTVEPETIVALAADSTVAGVKDSSGGGETFGQLVMLCQSNRISLRRFVGSVWRVTMSGIGAHGIVPGIANLVPRSISAAWEAGQRGDEEIARRFHEHVLTASCVMKIAPSSGAAYSGLKTALKLMGIIDHDTVSAPFRPLDDEGKAEIAVLLEKLRLQADSAHGWP